MKQVLVVDDNDIVRETLVAFLEDFGYKTLEAENGLIGLELFNKHKPDIMLLDLRMPVMDGMQVIEVMKKESPDTPIIVVSGNGLIRDAIEAIRAGASDYLMKPIEDMEVLKIALERSLERSQLIKDKALYSKQLEEKSSELEKMNKELRGILKKLQDDEEAGRRIQFQLLPEKEHKIGKYKFSHHLLPSLYLSGDFLDYFPINDDLIAFYIADVSGHGVSSAFITVLLKSIMNHYMSKWREDGTDIILNPETLIENINLDLLSENIDKFITLFFGIIDKQTNKLICSNGGQYPFPILRSQGEIKYIRKNSSPVGILDFVTYERMEIQLPDTFSLIMFSDGILEIMPGNELSYREEFLIKICNTDKLSVDYILDNLNLRNAKNLPDDITCLLIQKDK